MGDISLEDEEKLRSRVPRPVADFLLRRARASGPRADSVLGKLLDDTVPPDDDDDYSDYVYDAVPISPGLRNANDEDDDDLPDCMKTSPRSLFIEPPTPQDSDARKVGYGFVALLALFVILRLAAAVVAFFVKFTFSFAAIFALSAGIFVVIVLFRFF